MPNAGEVVKASDVSVQACRATRSTDQSIAHNTETVVAFTAESFDTDGMHSTVTDNSRITINTAGYYTVTFGGEFAGATPTNYGRLYVAIKLNGSTTIAREQTNPIDAASPIPQQLNVAVNYHFSVGDYIEAYVYQSNDSSAARALSALSDYSPAFTAARIGS